MGLNRSSMRRRALPVALASTFAAAAVHGQSTTGQIYGQATYGPNETVEIHGLSGIVRSVTVDSNGHYTIGSLPLGSYDVSLLAGGKLIDSRHGVQLRVGAGVEVNFVSKANVSNLSEVKVVSSTSPAIDVSAVDDHTVITAADLQKLPLARSAEAIALLAPGVTPGYSGFTGPLGSSLNSFGGSSVTENAYYVNGFNTTDPLSGFGGITLPYGAIDQEEIMNGGYGAAFGRSDGGVISQNGKRGTNEWHFGFQILDTPQFAKGSTPDTYYVNGSKAGQIYDRNSRSKYGTLTEAGYFGGPLIKDTLYMFGAFEGEHVAGNSIGSVNSSYNTKYQDDDPKGYLKFDWNINENNILEYTWLSNKTTYTGNLYDYDYDTQKTGAFATGDTKTSTSAKDNIIKYTSYITDDLTLSVLYGRQNIRYYTEAANSSSEAYISGAENQDPSITGGNEVISSNNVSTLDNPNHRSSMTNFRFDLNYKLGNHSLSLGIDNLDSRDIDDGTSTTGPGYYWAYSHGDANTDISDSPYVAAPGGNGYYVAKVVYNTAATVHVKQRAAYLEDSWQISDRWLAKIGIRDDAFTNYNPDGKAFLRLTKPQWAPRLGVAWDVFGDSSMKVYANAGRYYLAMPASVALRAAAGSTYTDEYYTYTGIAADGSPTGLTQLASSTGGAVSANNEYGQSPDPKTVASANIKSEYQDEFILGMDKQFQMAGLNWVWGAKAQVRKLRNILDDICDADTIEAVAVKEGYTDVDTSKMNGCYLSNPGRTNVYRLVNTSGGYDYVSVSAAQFGDPKPKRNYYSMEGYLDHPFDGKWAAKLDYVWSRSIGNTEGQVRSDIGQSDVSATVDWDFGQLMQYSGGTMSNDRTHQIKLFGSYQLTPQWMLSGNMMLLSGTPKSCLGYYGTDQSNPVGYGSYYHWCGGEPSRPGDAGRTPWQHIYSMSAEYRPDFAKHKLAFNIMVYNILNKSVPTAYYPIYGYSTAVNTSYMRAMYWSTPRYIRFSVSYDY